MTIKKLRIADAAAAGGLTEHTLMRLSLSFACDNGAKYAAWRDSEYTEDVHIHFQLYLQLSKYLNDGLFTLLRELWKGLQPLTTTAKQPAPRVVCIANERFVAWPGITEHWWDTWRDDYIPTDHPDAASLYVTIGIHLDTLVTRPLRPQS